MDLRLNVKKKKNKSCPRRVKEYTRKTMKLGDKNIIFYNNFTIHYINFPIYIYIPTWTITCHISDMCRSKRR